jgi:hypothetical protein
VEYNFEISDPENYNLDFITTNINKKFLENITEKIIRKTELQNNGNNGNKNIEDDEIIKYINGLNDTDKDKDIVFIHKRDKNGIFQIERSFNSKNNTI